ncbi:gephyrin-like molybdotransferase receptor GlpR [Streptomyces viridochromogenes]|uniref:divisome protein SepX/GlpR n=1 Tax=Streptomyces viridochromogenes TaxID=1938 RepID=UPI00069F209C|nr:gephyrin-like molybdotransferase receptor GlpR [Streptomyces viridochromogenes]KOG16187.1 membrane protein [Streptomyces viridochromogenes]KOG16461.1 membrane protein [Streptomyces viridochromogenes]
MSSSGLIYAVIVGAWAAYLVPMWLRRQDELNEARPTERFSTAIRLLSGRAGMERRYAKDLRARSAEEGELSADDPGDVTESVDVRAFAMPPTRPQTQAPVPAQASARPEPARESGREQAGKPASEHGSRPAPEHGSRQAPERAGAPSAETGSGPAAKARKRVPAARRAPSDEAAAARARRLKVLARRRRTTVMLFLAFTLGAIVAAVGGLAFLWAPGVPAVLLSGYIAYLRSQERRRFAYQMDRQQAEAAAQRLREHARQSRRRGTTDPGTGLDEPDEGPEPGTDPGLSALAADRRALVEQTDHAEWVDQQRERQRRPGHGDSWDPVPVPLPTYVTAPVAPRATPDVDLGAPDAWSSARSGTVGRDRDREAGADAADGSARGAESGDTVPDEERAEGGGRSDARRAASARRARERGRTPLFDQYEDGERPRAANE